MINEVETSIIEVYQLQEFLNQGYELVTTVTESHIEMQTVQEEVPTMQIWTSPNTSGGNYPYHNNGPSYITKQIPVSVISTRLIVKRTKAAKLLYEKGKNEDISRNSQSY